MKRCIVVTLRFEGIHSWPSCPIEEVKFLRDPHRHIFHVKATKEVSHNDRDVEIIWLKRQMESHIKDLFPFGNLGTSSCEDIAQYLIHQFGLKGCEVLEDGENGAFLLDDEKSDDEPLDTICEAKVCKCPIRLGAAVTHCPFCQGIKRAL